MKLFLIVLSHSIQACELFEIAVIGKNDLTISLGVIIHKQILIVGSAVDLYEVTLVLAVYIKYPRLG